MVEELAQSLSVVENGLTDLLAFPAVDVIEEEQEDPGTPFDGQLLPRGHLDGSRDYVAVDDDLSQSNTDQC